MISRVLLSVILLSIAVSSALAITCQTCNLTTTKESCMKDIQTTNCDSVDLDLTNQTADSCYTMKATRFNGSSVYIQHCTLKAGCDHICSYFNRTHLAYTLKTCETDCTMTTPPPPTSTNMSSTTPVPPTTTGTRFGLAFGLLAVPIFTWLLH